MAQRQQGKTAAARQCLSTAAFALSMLLMATAAQATDPWLVSLVVHPIDVSPDSADAPLSDEAAEGLVRQQRMLERSKVDLAAIEGFERVLGRSRCRKLAEARFHFDRFSPDVGRDLRDSPEFFDDARDAVLSSFLKLQRERVEERMGVETWWQSKREDRRLSKSHQADDRRWNGSDPRGIKLRLSPRLSDHALGLKMGLRRTGSWLDRASFRVRYDVDDAETQYILKFEDSSRFVHFSLTPDSRRFGDRLDLSVRFSW